MSRALATGVLALLLAGCATPPAICRPELIEVPVPASAVETARACPPLPLLAEDATTGARLLHHLTVIALYAQCAGSQK